MSSPDQPSQEHRVGITNAQEKNPDAMIAELTKRMNEYVVAGEYVEAVHTALLITPLSKDELREVFERHGVTILHLDHEAFGIYGGSIEPSYDLLVDGETSVVLAAAIEFGKRHVQEAVLIVRRTTGENDPAERLGLTMNLYAPISAREAVLIAAIAQASGFKGATFIPKRGEVTIYHTDDMEMTPDQFDAAVTAFSERVKTDYPSLTATSQKYIIQMRIL